jgi:hypothetical protein
MTFKESLEELLGTERGGVRMPAAMQRLLSKYYVEVALVESLDEVSISNMLADAKLAWDEEYEKDLPAIHVKNLMAWIAAKPVPADQSSPPTFGGAAAVHGEGGALRSGQLASSEEEETMLFGDAGATERERAQLEKDKSEQNLSGVRLLVIATAIELGSVPPASDVIGSVRYGSDVRLSELVRRAHCE